MFWWVQCGAVGIARREAGDRTPNLTRQISELPTHMSTCQACQVLMSTSPLGKHLPFYPLFYYSAVLVTTMKLIRNYNRFKYIRASSRGRVFPFVVTRVNMKLRPQCFKVGLLDEDYVAHDGK